MMRPGRPRGSQFGINCCIHGSCGWIINAVTYADDDVVFTHTVHFKAQGRIVPDWANGMSRLSSRGEADQPLKRDLAKEAVELAMKGRPRKLYHATHCANRNSIRKDGLLLTPTEGEAIHSITSGFLFCSKLPASAEQIDVWEVDTSGLAIQIDDTDTPPDPEDTWWVVYGPRVIEPWRLRLIDPPEDQLGGADVFGAR